MVRLPLFPLGAVVFPGRPLPLQIFETRYRRMVLELMGQPASQRRFGAVAIRFGHEVGIERPNELHQIGCIAQLRRVIPHPDGRFDVLAVGVGRFRLLTAESEPDGLLRGEVLPLADADPVGAVEAAAAAVLVERARARFAGYVAELRERRGLEPGQPPELPRSPQAFSFAAADSMLLGLTDRQALLAAEPVTRRLQLVDELLRKETGVTRHSGTRPAVELTRLPLSRN